MRIRRVKQVREKTHPDDPEIAALKAELHRLANGYLQAAIDAGNWYEAIAIAESLISDRIESYFAEHHDRHDMLSLEGNIRNMEEVANLYKPEDLQLVVDIKIWKEDRNKAIHEIVKVRKGEKLDWESRISAASATAKEGLELTRRVKNWSRRIP